MSDVTTQNWVKYLGIAGVSLGVLLWGYKQYVKNLNEEDEPEEKQAVGADGAAGKDPAASKESKAKASQQKEERWKLLLLLIQKMMQGGHPQELMMILQQTKTKYDKYFAAAIDQIDFAVDTGGNQVAAQQHMMLAQALPQVAELLVRIDIPYQDKKLICKTCLRKSLEYFTKEKSPQHHIRLTISSAEIGQSLIDTEKRLMVERQSDSATLNPLEVPAEIQKALAPDQLEVIDAWKSVLASVNKNDPGYLETCFMSHLGMAHAATQLPFDSSPAPPSAENHLLIGVSHTDKVLELYPANVGEATQQREFALRFKAQLYFELANGLSKQEGAGEEVKELQSEYLEQAIAPATLAIKGLPLKAEASVEQKFMLLLNVCQLHTLLKACYEARIQGTKEENAERIALHQEILTLLDTVQEQDLVNQAKFKTVTEKYATLVEKMTLPNQGEAAAAPAAEDSTANAPADEEDTGAAETTDGGEEEAATGDDDAAAEEGDADAEE